MDVLPKARAGFSTDGQDVQVIDQKIPRRAVASIIA